jgi:hypothetical protein
LIEDSSPYCAYAELVRQLADHFPGKMYRMSRDFRFLNLDVLGTPNTVASKYFEQPRSV